MSKKRPPRDPFYELVVEHTPTDMSDPAYARLVRDIAEREGRSVEEVHEEMRDKEG